MWFEKLYVFMLMFSGGFRDDPVLGDNMCPCEFLDCLLVFEDVLGVQGLERDEFFDPVRFDLRLEGSYGCALFYIDGFRCWVGKADVDGSFNHIPIGRQYRGSGLVVVRRDNAPESMGTGFGGLGINASAYSAYLVWLKRNCPGRV